MDVITRTMDRRVMIGIVLSLLGVVCTLSAIWVQLCHIETVLTIIAKNDGDNWEWKK